MKKGSFQTSREIFDNPIWKNVFKFRLFFYIYGNAVFSKQGINYPGVTVQRGQFLRSYRKIQEDLEYIENKQIKSYSLSQIKRMIDSLVKEGRLEVFTTELGTLFTIVNYELYQGFGDFTSGTWNSIGTVSEQYRNNNKNVEECKECKEDNIYVEVIEYLNQKLGKKYKLTDAYRKQINGRLKEKYSLEDFKTVIDIKYSQWHNNEKMKQYLRPSTLFGSKFTDYLNEETKEDAEQKKGGWNIGRATYL